MRELWLTNTSLETIENKPSNNNDGEISGGYYCYEENDSV